MAGRGLVGVGLVFPETRSHTASVDYMTADIASMPDIDVDAPDDADDVDEPGDAAE